MSRQSKLRNRLLSRLSAKDYALLADKLEPARAERGATLAEPDKPFTSVYFLESGIASVVACSPEGQRVEAGIIGREGFVHPASILGTDRVPFHIQIQMADDAHRITRADLLTAVAQSASLREMLLRFVHVNATQISFTSLSNAVHQVDERLARWLLMCHDRSETDDLSLTHDFIGLMLAVRRPSVTNSLHVLEGRGFVELSRGYIAVTNRAGLEEFAGDAYGKPEAEYRRLLGPL